MHIIMTLEELKKWMENTRIIRNAYAEYDDGELGYHTGVIEKDGKLYLSSFYRYNEPEIIDRKDGVDLYYVTEVVKKTRMVEEIYYETPDGNEYE